MTQEEYLQYLFQKANAAVAGGVPQAEVEARLQERMRAAGFALEEPVSDETKKAYKDMVVPDLAQDVYAASQVRNSPQQGIFGNVKSDVDVEYYPDVQEDWKRAYLNADKNVAAAFTGGLERAAGAGLGLIAPAASAVNSLVWPSQQDAPFQAAQKLLKEGTERQRGAVGGAGMVGTIGSALAGGFLAEPMARGMESLDRGQSLTEAEKDAALSSAVNLGGVALGLPFARAQGLLGIGQRAAVQIPGSVGLTYGERALQDEEFTNTDLAMAIGGGAFGSLFREPPKAAKAPKAPIEEFKTGDEAIDAGINSVLKADEEFDFEAARIRQENILADRARTNQGDLFTAGNESVLQGDLFGAEPVTGLQAELRRRRAEAAARKEEAARTPEEQLALEQEYLFSQQERLNASASRPRVEEPEAQAELWDVGVPRNEQPPDVSMDVDADGNPIRYTEELPNPAVREAFREAGLRRALGLEEQNLYPDIRTPNQPQGPIEPTVFEPSSVRTVEQVAEQGQLPLEAMQPDMFGELPRQGFTSEPTRYVAAGKKAADVQQKATPTNKPLSQLLAEAETGRNVFAARSDSPFINNASGESAASVEAINRISEERNAGRHRLVIEPNGNVRPLLGVDAVDYFPKKGEIVVQRNVGRNEWTPLYDSGLGRDLEQGRINASRSKLAEAVEDLESDAVYAAPAIELLTDKSGNKVFPYPRAMPALVVNQLSEGALTGRSVLDSIADNQGNMFTEASEARAWAGELRSLADKFGGLDTPINVFDPNNETHLNIMARLGDVDNSASAVFDPTSNQILLMRGVTNSILVHEVGHAITLRALFAGEEGRLSGKAQSSYAALTSLFDTLRPQLEAASKAKTDAARTSRGDRAAYEVGNTTGYGLTRIEEFMSEMFSNQRFRDHLRQMKITPELEKSLPAYGRLALGKVRNVYDAVVKLVRNVLGLSPKADNALDAMFSASKKFFDDIDNVEASEIRLRNSKQLRPAAAKVNERGQQEARGLATQVGRALFNSKGIEPVVTAAGRTRQNIVSLGELEAMQSATRLAKVRTEANAPDIDKAMAGDKAAWNRLAPEAKAVVKAEYEHNYDRSLEIAKAIAADPNITPQQEDVAKAILQRAGKYQATAYQANEIKGHMQDKMKLYEKANDKLAKGEALSTDEAAAHNSVMTARRYLEQSWLPDLDKLAKMPTDKLEELYKFHTQLNPDQQFRGFEKDARRSALIGSVADRLRKLSDRDAVIEQVVAAAAGLGRKRSGARAYYQNMRRSQDVYSQLTHVPEELKQFWGEINEPVARNVATVRNQYSYLANLSAQNQLRTEGMGKLFSESPSGPHTEGLSGEALGPLQGLYTSPDVARALDSVFVMDKSMGDLLDASLSKNVGDVLIHGLREAARPVRFLSGKTKLLSVVYNPANFVHNFAGSGLQLVANGNVDPRTYLQGMNTMRKIMVAERGSSMDEAVRDAYRYGLVEYSQIEELRKSRANDRIARYMEEAAGNPATLASKIWEATKEVPELTKELYAAMDLYSKFANWHNELDFWVKYNQRKGTGKSLEQIKEEVARRVNDTNITPSMAPRLVKELESVGATRFATYYTEVARTMKNNALTGIGDMKLAMNEGFDPQLFMHGAMRVLGTTGSVWGHNAMFAGAAKLGAGALGLAASELAEDDPRKKYMDKDKFFNAMQPLVLEGNDGKEYVYDFSRPNPFAPIATPAYKVFEALSAYANGDEKEAKAKASQAIDNLAGLWSANTMWKGFIRAVKGQAPSLKRTAEPTYNRLHETLTEWGMSSKNADRLLSAIEPAAPAIAKNIFASENIKDDTIAALKAAGTGIQELDITKDLAGFAGRAGKQGIQDARADYVDLMKQNYQSSPERLEKAFLSTLKKAAAPYEKLRLGTQAAKAQGASRREIMDSLKAAGVAESMRYTLYNDKPMKVSALKAELDADFSADSMLAGADEEERAEARERFRFNKKEMRRLLKKYESVNVEEL